MRMDALVGEANRASVYSDWSAKFPANANDVAATFEWLPRGASAFQQVLVESEDIQCSHQQYRSVIHVSFDNKVWSI